MVLVSETLTGISVTISVTTFLDGFRVASGRVMTHAAHATRRVFGGVSEKKDRNGRTIGWMAYYANPKIRERKVYRQFSTQALAREWLEGEELLVRAYRRGTADWIHPKDREARERARGMLFMDWADEWMDTWGRFRSRSAREPLEPARYTS